MKIPTEAEGDDATNVDLTPMIDIVFQLLLFFMVTATFQNDERDLSIDVPEAEHGRTLETLPETLVVGVRKDGSFTIDAQVLDKDALRQALARAKRKNPKQRVIVRAHKDVPTRHPVTVLDVCAGLSIETALATTAGGDGSGTGR